MRKLAILALAVSMCLGAFAGTALATEYLSIATGGTGGTYYPVGGALADLVSSKVSDLQVTGETGNASAANLNLIGTEQIEMALVQNDIAYWAYHGKMMFKDKPYKNVRSIACLYPEHIQLVAMEDSGINGVQDLEGKRVSVGAPGSGVEGDVRSIYDVAGLTYEDMDTYFLDFNNTTQRLKDGQLDAGFVVGGYPVASIMDLATMHDIKLVNFSDEFLAKLHNKYPFFAKDTIPAGTYEGIDEAQTVSVMAMMVCRAGLSEEVVYEFTKAMWDNIEDIYDVHAKAKQLTLESAFQGISVPIHPGAAKYYEEQGMTLPEIPGTD
ncbi:MAG: TAXI family TRAP transporter solute-binding subunit [Synergistales bacterium]|nr:TAXI family TRAP transporter solute-binding subunit [Synergistales bacterium]